MTVTEKRLAVMNYCGGKKCSNCALLNSSGTCEISIYDSTEDELDYALTKISVANESNVNGVDEPKNDIINRPAHYTDGKIEVIDFIEDKKLGFCLGNAIKYIARAGKKDPTKTVEDLKKAIWYLNRRIKELEEVSL